MATESFQPAGREAFALRRFPAAHPAKNGELAADCIPSLARIGAGTDHCVAAQEARLMNREVDLPLCDSGWNLLSSRTP